MTRFEEGYLAFEFGNRWQIFKFDDHRDYREKMERVDETKAIDFLGIFDEHDLYLIEVKDFREYRIETKERHTTGELAIELAQKVRDSLACIIGAYHTSSNPEHWQPYAALLCDANSTVKVVLWLEHDLPSHSLTRKKALASVQVNVFKQKLVWLTKRVFVCSTNNPNIPDIVVHNLARSK